MRLPTPSATVLATITALFTLSSAHSDTQHGQYVLTDDLSYKNFFGSFDFFSGPDPTKGFVLYQNLTSAISQKLIGYLQDTQSVFLGVDSTNKDPNGRASVRLESKQAWNQGLLVADIRHMPSPVCGSWPAFWLLGFDKDTGKSAWPLAGEVDIMEGVNDYEHNAVTLHTSKGCIVDNSTLHAAGHGETPFTGLLATDDCDVAAPGQGKNVGCSIKAPKTITGIQTGSGAGSKETILPSYGTEFNKVGGGIYAMEWTSSAISVWFFPRNSSAYTTHFGNTTTASTLDPSTWGVPVARFSGSGCNITERFQNLKIIFNTSYCGEWAGKEWDKSCAAKTGVDTCEAYVRDNPEAFKEVYWEIAGLKWFQRTTEPEQEPSSIKAKGRQYRW
ncbi:glycoside hydrolase family 16 protein [Cucurbitaria berberidis CBS 394.84]|uniref:Glycoside hydrolase family 16 protein n=1 Tax=Cucurbitaria berberidis CBS 394.84 TaxID=1168544 RepID=A0A9P4GDX9_9PLEO|nr:glycoside hydrolase family 16 protein [Cucurbitaria berberidis CBS 394.84]KAF1843842.1 glycoside hydrolase family 16 protein [Cucurbitaria berberidis CBS 394.84]